MAPNSTPLYLALLLAAVSLMVATPAAGRVRVKQEPDFEELKGGLRFGQGPDSNGVEPAEIPRIMLKEFETHHRPPPEALDAVMGRINRLLEELTIPPARNGNDQANHRQPIGVYIPTDDDAGAYPIGVQLSRSQLSNKRPGLGAPPTDSSDDPLGISGASRNVRENRYSETPSIADQAHGFMSVPSKSRKSDTNHQSAYRQGLTYRSGPQGSTSAGQSRSSGSSGADVRQVRLSGSHRRPLGSEEVAMHTPMSRSTNEFEWKRHEAKNNWNNLRGMWGKRAISERYNDNLDAFRSMLDQEARNINADDQTLALRSASSRSAPGSSAELGDNFVSTRENANSHRDSSTDNRERNESANNGSGTNDNIMKQQH